MFSTLDYFPFNICTQHSYLHIEKNFRNLAIHDMVFVILNCSIMFEAFIISLPL